MKSSPLVAVVFAVLLFGTLFAGTAAAVSSEPQELPEESEVGAEMEATFELTELFDEFNEWTLAAETELVNATWTIRQFDQAGEPIDREDIDGSEASQPIDIDDGTASVEVRVTGTTPEIETFSYDPPDRFVVSNFTQQRDGGTEREIATHETHHFTQQSSEARAAIDQARSAVDSSSSSDAQSSLETAISAYEGGNFENAITNAERAEEEASQSQLLRTGLLVGGIAIVVLLVAFGGYRVYRSRQKGPDRLK